VAAIRFEGVEGQASRRASRTTSAAAIAETRTTLRRNGMPLENRPIPVQIVYLLLVTIGLVAVLSLLSAWHF
jgi:hypothetical protein